MDDVLEDGLSVGDGTENNSYRRQTNTALLIIIASHLTATLSPSVAI